MGREIKFRAWVPRDSKMFSVTSITFSGTGVRAIATFRPVSKRDRTYVPTTNRVLAGHFELMQYTGLKDKNGVEIYEGDVVAMFGRSQYSEVFWAADAGGWMVWAIDSGASSLREGFLAHYQITAEVVGNVYENPDLLQEAA